MPTHQDACRNRRQLRTQTRLRSRRRQHRVQACSQPSSPWSPHWTTFRKLPATQVSQPDLILLPAVLPVMRTEMPLPAAAGQKDLAC